jgi:hypothetical protein
VATSARPSVHRIRSSGTASAFDVGLDSGMMTGRFRMVRHTSHPPPVDIRPELA